MNTKFRFHVLGLPHCPCTIEHCACAYQNKVFKFCQMMTAKGHTVYHYGVEGSNPTCYEHITTLSKATYNKYFGSHDYKKTYYPIQWDPALPYWQEINTFSAREISRRLQRKDLICIIGGTCQRPVLDILQPSQHLFQAVEYGIGYYGPFAKYKAFESYAHMHNLYGRWSHDPDGNYYDAVIPNYFDVKQFTYQPEPREYVLFMGRMIARKGVGVAIEACERAGLPLLLCGQGARQVDDTTIITEDATYKVKNARYVGYADVKRRNDLMGHARAIIAPTQYTEPFGGVAVEAQFCGTGAITTDWGAFTETVEHGKTGYRCRTMEQFAWALQNTSKLDRFYIRNRAISLYSLEKVGAMFEEYFAMIQDVWEQGFYQAKTRSQLDWLNKF